MKTLLFAIPALVLAAACGSQPENASFTRQVVAADSLSASEAMSTLQVLSRQDFGKMDSGFRREVLLPQMDILDDQVVGQVALAADVDASIWQELGVSLESSNGEHFQVRGQFLSILTAVADGHILKLLDIKRADEQPVSSFFRVNSGELERVYGALSDELFADESLTFIKETFATLLTTPTSGIGRLIRTGDNEIIANLEQTTGAEINFIAGDIFTFRSTIGQALTLTGERDVFYLEARFNLRPNPAVIVR